MENFKKDFPLLCRTELVYLDNAATSQRPWPVLKAEQEFYERYNANPMRGLYSLGIKATDQYEQARESVRNFIHASRAEEIIFTRNTTESINLVAYSYGLHHLKEGDEILVTIAEHHSNLLPWQMVSKQTGASLVFLECGEDGTFSREAVRRAVSSKTKFAAVTHISNVSGRVSPVKEIIDLVHKNGGMVFIDAAQSAPHMPVDVVSMDADFLAFSGHKLMGPMGIGVLYGKKEILDKMPPFLTGGEMIDSVTRNGAVYAPLPHKFEAGTVNGAGAAGLRAAIEYIDTVGMEKIRQREEMLTAAALEEMQKIPGIRVLGSRNAEDHSGILSFTLEGVHPHDIASVLDAEHIAVRAGHHCAQPLLQYLGVPSAARASISFYNTEEDIQRFITSLKDIRRKMGYGQQDLL
ncbi:aminotransferase class V-fold PLP-dependent enzyme [Anaerostipes sp.]|uniref:aminotransferase class V-fold PLP-dependent enzyme n=1 Tax=Anaerostipes sp. TaxID=1872530 RepID=UPI0025C24317|nr:SufS family cysteine desulfurase [Anaerostipes sp.]MBS7007414.1 SufS family cysteine desulfurase [Anaerostipes sp.]